MENIVGHVQEPCKKRTRRSRPSLARTQKKVEKLKQEHPEKHAMLVEHRINQLKLKDVVVLSAFPDDFVRRKRDQATVDAVTRAHYSTDVNTYTRLHHLRRNVLYIAPGTNFDQNFLCALFTRIVLPGTSVKLMKAFLAYQATNPIQAKTRDNRSSTHAAHVGMWAMYRDCAYLTSETIKQSPETIAALDELLTLIKQFILIPVSRVLQEYFPEDWARRQKAYANIQPQLADSFASRPAIDFEGIVSTIAIKPGGSETIHLDTSDGDYARTFVYAFGPYTGGGTVFPQPAVVINPTDRDILSANTKYLSHFTEPIQGLRYILTMFFEHNLFIRGGVYEARTKKVKSGAK